MHPWMTWIPRVAAAAVALFFSVFALDAINEGVVEFLRHLVPPFALLLVAALAWRYEWVGAIAFFGLAVLYALVARRWDWILVISGPLAMVGFLYLAAWWVRRAPRSFATPNGLGPQGERLS
jgi:hypothetical protein